LNGYRQRMEREHSRTRADLAGLARSYRLFLGNDRELQSFLTAHEQPPAVLELWAPRNRVAFEGFLDEVDRLLHNYLASALSLREHTRRVRRKYAQAAGLEEAYDEHVRQSFLDDPACSFVQGLRNYCLHFRLPIARGQLSGEVTAGEWSMWDSVNLLKSDLLAWENWGPPAKAYLHSAPDKIDLKDVVRQYTAAVTTFHTWFTEASSCLVSIALAVLVPEPEQINSREAQTSNATGNQGSSVRKS
jgi:hypothetical protein